MNPYTLNIGTWGAQQFVGMIVIYVYFAYTTMMLAKRLNIANSWLAWIPFLNLFLMTKMAKLDWWWLLGLFIPFVNFFVAGYIWSEIGKQLGKEWWVGALIAIPLIGWLVPGYLVVTTGSNFRKPVENIKS